MGELIDIDKTLTVQAFITITRLTPEEISYIGFDSKRHQHACDDMMSGYEAGFCSNSLYIIEPRDDAPYALQSNWYSYACDTHLNKLVLEAALKMEEKFLDRAFMEWEDQQANLERQERMLFDEVQRARY